MALLPHGYRWPALVMISRSPAAVHSNIEQIHRLSNYILIHTNNKGFFRILKACISPTGISNNSNPLDSIPCSHEHGCPSLTGLHKSLALCFFHETHLNTFGEDVASSYSFDCRHRLNLLKHTLRSLWGMRSHSHQFITVSVSHPLSLYTLYTHSIYVINMYTFHYASFFHGFTVVLKRLLRFIYQYHLRLLHLGSRITVSTSAKMGNVCILFAYIICIQRTLNWTWMHKIRWPRWTQWITVTINKDSLIVNQITE